MAALVGRAFAVDHPPSLNAVTAPVAMIAPAMAAAIHLRLRAGERRWLLRGLIRQGSSGSSGMRPGDVGGRSFSILHGYRTIPAECGRTGSAVCFVDSIGSRSLGSDRWPDPCPQAAKTGQREPLESATHLWKRCLVLPQPIAWRPRCP